MINSWTVLKSRYVSLLLFFFPFLFPCHSSSMEWTSCFLFYFSFLTFTKLWKLWEWSALSLYIYYNAIKSREIFNSWSHLLKKKTRSSWFLRSLIYRNVNSFPGQKSTWKFSVQAFQLFKWPENSFSNVLNSQTVRW